MKVNYFQQVPYRHLPDDFEANHESVVTTPYHGLVDPKLIVEAYRNALDECMYAARAGFDGVAITEHGQSSYDMAPNPDLLEAALAYATETQGLATAIYPIGRSLGKSREPIRVAEEQAMLDCMSNGRLICGFPVGLWRETAAACRTCHRRSRGSGKRGCVCARAPFRFDTDQRGGGWRQTSRAARSSAVPGLLPGYPR